MDELTPHQKQRILALRKMGYRLWRIAADVRQPIHRVAAVIESSGVMMMRLEKPYEYKR